MTNVRLAAWCGLFLSLAIAGCSPAPSPSGPPAKVAAGVTSGPRHEKAKTIKLVVEFGDGKQQVYEPLAWAEGDTVLGVLDKVKAARDPLTYSQSGSGETAFVDEINGVKNEGTGPGKKNWLFWVNDKLADRSAGAYPIQAGDEVIWKFAVWPVK